MHYMHPHHKVEQIHTFVKRAVDRLALVPMWCCNTLIAGQAAWSIFAACCCSCTVGERSACMVEIHFVCVACLLWLQKLFIGPVGVHVCLYTACVLLFKCRLQVYHRAAVSLVVLNLLPDLLITCLPKAADILTTL